MILHTSKGDQPQSAEKIKSNKVIKSIVYVSKKCKDNYLKDLKKYVKFYDTCPEFYQLEY